MEIRTTVNGSKSISHDYRAERKSFTAPVVERTEVIDGIKYYFSEDGKQFRADLFDVMFKVPKTKIKGRFYKGKDPCPRI